MPRDALHIRSSLARYIGEGADAERISDEAMSTWCEIDAALSPVIGQRGVAALFNRTLFLTRPTHAWLADVQENTAVPDVFAALRLTLRQQTSSNAAAAHIMLLETFVDLLTRLIGEEITERLLGSVWDRPRGDGTV